MRMRFTIPSRNLEQSFQYLYDKSEEGPLSIGDLLQIFSGRTRLILIAILCIPFCFPISIPGLSIPLGILIGFLALEILFNFPILIPNSWLSKELSQETTKSIANSGLAIVKKLKPIIKTRWTQISYSKITRYFAYLMIPVLAILLALPIPLPFSNMPFSWPILLISIGLIEDDGLILLIGMVLGFISILAMAILSYHLTLFLIR